MLVPIQHRQHRYWDGAVTAIVLALVAITANEQEYERTLFWSFQSQLDLQKSAFWDK